ncbi:MAG: hypothetical protein HFJ09_14100 [Lachnospiraceae bacterium]|nr:hypothetical protein [Lachnospiraceae bacterium]
MELSKLKTMEEKELVSKAIQLDQEQKKVKKELDTVKAEIQARGLQVLEDRNIKYIKYYSPDGSAAVTDTQSLDVVNVDKLKKLLSRGVWKQNVTETTKTDYKYKPVLERVLKAIFTGDYTFEYSLEEFIDEHLSVNPDRKQKNLLLKKLKGDYAKDRDTLISVLGFENENEAPDFDVELYYIYKIMNGELIRAVLPEEFLDETIKDIKKCLIVDSKTSITIDYKKE